MVDITQNTINNGLALMRTIRKELNIINTFRQTKHIRAKRKELLADLERIQEKTREQYEQLQSIKNNLEAPTE
jgi:hypothetical protein